MLEQSRRRNRESVATGRLILLRGDTTSLADLAPLDLVFAVHVLYFWHHPDVELARIRHALQPEGTLALGYRLREHMPRVSQATFPNQGHRLYDSDQDVSSLLSAPDSRAFSTEPRAARREAPPGGWRSRPGEPPTIARNAG